jgi:4-amino-4-deoxy-L-arabinose transferase-like glycosyltransferase
MTPGSSIIDNNSGAPGGLRAQATPAVIFAALVILAVGLALFLHRLGAAEICGANEAVEALAVQRMVERGQLLFPVQSGSQPMYKPPLFHWTAAGLDRLLGFRKVTEFNLRLVSATYALAGVALTMAFAFTNLRQASSALLSGLILLGSYQYVSQGRFGRVDMTLTFFENLALFLFLWWVASLPGTASDDAPVVERRGKVMRWLFAAALGCAVLAKGPVGALLPLLAIGLWCVVATRADVPRRLITPGSAALAMGIASSWYIACFLSQHYEILGLQLGAENFGRFFGTLGRMPALYYAGPLFLNSVPLSLLVPLAVFSGLRAPVDPVVLATSDDRNAEKANRAAQFLAIYWLVSVIFFSLAAYKRKAYLLPLWPAAAILVTWWTEVAPPAQWRAAARRVLAATCVVMIVFNFFFLPWKEQHECEGSSYRTIGAAVNRTAGANSPLFLYRIDSGLAPLSFYLDRRTTVLNTPLVHAPAGLILTTPAAWRDYAVQNSARSGELSMPGRSANLRLTHVMTIPGPPILVLLRSGG